MSDNNSDRTDSEDQGDPSSGEASPTEDEKNQGTTTGLDEPERAQTEKEGDTTLGEARAAEEQEKPPAPEWLIGNIAELSKNARSIYLLFLGFLAYCAVTVVGTSDRQILLGESVRLPLVGVDVSLTGFFVLAPVVAIGTFAYLQLYLQELKALKKTLDEDYQPVESGRLYPWMLNIVDHPQPGIIGWFQRAAVKGVLWWMLPGVLFLIAGWYLKAQDSSVIGWMIILMPAVGVAAAFYFWHKYAAKDHSSRTESKRWGNWAMLGLGGVLQVVFLWVFVQTAILGRVSGPLSGLATIDVSNQSLIKEKKHIPYWVDLNGKRLHGAELGGAVLINADLRDARLQEADLSGARLDSADLSGARLDSANLSEARLGSTDLIGSRLDSARLTGAHLHDADVLGAHLNDADLSGAHLEGADLARARLEGADLSGAHLEGANLSGARLKGSDLMGIGLQEADLSGARLDSADLIGGRLDSARLTGARLPEAMLYQAFLPEVNLSGAHLEGADLRRARLQGAILSTVHLEGANLSGVLLDSADLSGAHLEGVDLSGGRLKRANLLGTHLDSASLANARLDNARLTRASLLGADLSGAHLEGADLSGARLQGAGFMGAHLEGANLSGAHLESAILVRARLHGAVFAELRSDMISAPDLRGADLVKSKAKNLRCSTGVRNKLISCFQHPEMKSRIVGELCKAASIRDMTTDPEILDAIRVKCSTPLDDPENGDG